MRLKNARGALVFVSRKARRKARFAAPKGSKKDGLERVRLFMVLDRPYCITFQQLLRILRS